MQRVREQVQVPEQLHSGAGRVKSVTVAVLDTGIAYHPDLVGRLLAFSDFVEGRNFPYDDNGHGTHVCGIVCGSGELSGGRFRGMAPETKLVVGKVLDRQGEGSCDSMQEALEWVLRVKNRYGIRVLNISVGIGDLKERYKEQMLRKSLELLWDHNILVVCAAGNTGPEDGSISEMASSRKVLTVGCHDGRYCKNDPGRCETYSGRGRRYDVTRKPDIVAPGTRILSCNAFWQNRNGRIYRPYVAKSGTSMATPIVSGAAALAMEKYPGITIDVRQLDEADRTLAITGGEYDFCFMPRDMVPESSGIESIITHNETLSVVTAKNSKFSGRKSVKLSELADESILVLSESVAPIVYMEIMDLFRTFHMTPKISNSFDDLVSIYVSSSCLSYQPRLPHTLLTNTPIHTLLMMRTQA